jgi:hypothetical protein
MLSRMNRGLHEPVSDTVTWQWAGGGGTPTSPVAYSNGVPSQLYRGRGRAAELPRLAPHAPSRSGDGAGDTCPSTRVGRAVPPGDAGVGVGVVGAGGGGADGVRGESGGASPPRPPPPEAGSGGGGWGACSGDGGCSGRSGGGNTPGRGAGAGTCMGVWGMPLPAGTPMGL